nr:MAG TPA: hypothetical protein [Caudoviricetes sp.]
MRILKECRFAYSHFFILIFGGVKSSTYFCSEG